MIFIVIHQIPFHLRWRHSPIGLRYINHRQIEVRKDVDRHARKRQDRAKRHTDDRDEHADGVAESSAKKPHGYDPPCFLSCKNCRNGARSPCDAATEARFCHTARWASVSSISACTSKLWASETSTRVASPAWYRA